MSVSSTASASSISTPCSSKRLATPAPVIAQLYAAMKKASADAGVARRFEEQGVDIELADAVELTDMIRKETALWDKVIREANIQVN